MKDDERIEHCNFCNFHHLLLPWSLLQCSRSAEDLLQCKSISPQFHATLIANSLLQIQARLTSPQVYVPGSTWCPTRPWNFLQFLPPPRQVSWQTLYIWYIHIEKSEWISKSKISYQTWKTLVYLGCIGKSATHTREQHYPDWSGLTPLVGSVTSERPRVFRTPLHLPGRPCRHRSQNILHNRFTRVNDIFGFYLKQMPSALAKKCCFNIRRKCRHLCNFHHLLGTCANKACKFKHGISLLMTRHRHFCIFHHLLGTFPGGSSIYPIFI